MDQILILLFKDAFKDFTALVIHHFVILGSYSLGLLNTPSAYGGVIMVSYQVSNCLVVSFLCMTEYLVGSGVC